MLALVFEEFTVRFVGTAVEPEWVAVDVAAVFEISPRSLRRYLAELDDDEKGYAKFDTPGGTQEFVTVREPGLYHLAYKSRSDKVNRFKQWVRKEVVPSIRKYGTYPPPSEDISSDTLLPSTEQLEFMRSRAWEKAELEGKRMSWDEIAQHSGFDRVKRLGGCHE